VREERPHTVHDAPEVDAHHPFPRLDAAEPRVAAACHTGVVAHHVDMAEAFERLRRQRLDLFALAHIGEHRQRVDTGGGDPLLGRLQRAGLDVGEHERAPGRGEGVGKRQADTARGAGDHHDLPIPELHRRGP
jgi:hypothetical protein